VTVTLRRDRVVITGARECIDVAPVIHLSAPTGRSAGGLGGRRLLEIGDDGPNAQRTALRVDLFDLDAGVPPGLDRAACLEPFFRHALKRIIEKNVFRIRPTVTVSGIAAITPIFGPKTRTLLEDALRTGGAAAVIFEDA
jgi:hypothetical protein